MSTTVRKRLIPLLAPSLRGMFVGTEPAVKLSCDLRRPTRRELCRWGRLVVSSVRPIEQTAARELNRETPYPDALRVLTDAASRMHEQGLAGKRNADNALDEQAPLAHTHHITYHGRAHRQIPVFAVRHEQPRERYALPAFFCGCHTFLSEVRHDNG